jgi:hypothetical protein
VSEFDEGESLPMGHLHWGRRLETSGRPKGWLGSLEPLAEATDENVAAARKFFHEGRPEDFDIVGRRKWVDRATGVLYVICLHQPLAQMEPKKSADLFVVDGDRLVFLRRAGEQGEAAVLGEVGGRRAKASDPASTERLVY